MSSRNPGPVGWSEQGSMRTKVKHARTSSLADRFLRTAALCALIGLLGSAPATARGGGHGMGHFGLHGGEHMMAPAYVLITVSTVSDADAFKKAIQDMTTAVAPFTGRLAVDAEATCLGGTAAQHVVMIRFADAEQALFLRLKNLVVEPQDQGSTKCQQTTAIWSTGWRRSIRSRPRRCRRSKAAESF